MPEDQPTTDSPKSIDELFHAALTDCDEAAKWSAVTALQHVGTHEVLLRAQLLCASSIAVERRIGADIIGQLGVPARSLPRECIGLLLQMLQIEVDADVLQAILVGLSHQHSSVAIEPAARFSDHSDPSVRHAVVLAMNGHDNRLAIETLIRLSNDPAEDVRDWATFALGSQLEVDTPEIRDALTGRLDDPDDDTRGEALVGLARRNDRRVIPVLLKELAAEWIGWQAIEAAELMTDPEILAALVSLRDRSDVPPDLLERAIASCSHSNAANTRP